MAHNVENKLSTVVDTKDVEMPTVRIDDDQYKELKKIRDADGITIQAAVRRAIGYWLAEYQVGRHQTRWPEDIPGDELEAAIQKVLNAQKSD